MTTKRQDRELNRIRPVEIIPGFHRLSEGSVLYRAGGTAVLVTASVDESVPDFLKGSNRGWVTAEYQMHPRSNPKRREGRDGRGRAVSGRTQEIQRLIGRSLRAAVELERLGERTIAIDCDVLEADGGTRTASITGGYLALVFALSHLRAKGLLSSPVLRDQVAAVSVGLVDDALALDLCYAEDSTAQVDLNVVATARGAIVEIQGTAEGRAVPRAQIDRMVDLGLEGIQVLASEQTSILSRAGIDLGALTVKP